MRRFDVEICFDTQVIHSLLRKLGYEFELNNLTNITESQPVIQLTSLMWCLLFISDEATDIMYFIFDS